MALTDKQELFVKEYLVDLNATQAAIRAGYSKRTAASIGDENLRKPEIQVYKQKLMDERAERTRIKADDVLRELAHIAFDDIRNYLDFYPDITAKYGMKIEIKDSRLIDTRGISEVSIGKDGFKFKTYCKDTALVNVGKHLGMFADNVNLNANLSLTYEEKLNKVLDGITDE